MLYQHSQGSRCAQQYTNMMQEAHRPQKCYTNADKILKSDNKDKPGVTDNENSKKMFLSRIQPR